MRGARAAREEATCKERVTRELSALQPVAGRDERGQWVVWVTRSDGTRAQLGRGMSAGTAWACAAGRLHQHGAAALLRLGGFTTNEGGDDAGRD